MEGPSLVDQQGELQEDSERQDADAIVPRVVVDTRWCKGSGNNKAEVAAEDQCSVGGLCEIQCPDFA